MSALLSAVVPALDEAAELPATLESLAGEADEVVVADGGSRDGTPDLARRAGARVVDAARGRGRQLNAGAASARGDLLWFVHADTRVASGSGARLRAAVAAGAVGGAFEIRFGAAGWRYRLGGTLASARSRRFRFFLGDQAPFARRADYLALDGFRDWPLFEDVDFCRRLRERGPLAILTPPVVTSARRFERIGPLAGVARNWFLLLLYELGVSPPRLARLYRAAR